MAARALSPYILDTMSGGPTILVVRFSALGDVILTTPLLRALHRACPTARIVYVTKAAYAPVIARHPAVTEVVSHEPGRPLRDLARRLRRTRWDYRLDLHGSLRAVALRWLLGGRWGTVRKPRWHQAAVMLRARSPDDDTLPVAERYFEAARALGAVPDGEPADVHTAADDDARAAVLARPPYVALAPGAAHATKRWPAEYWQSLAQRLADAGRRVVGVGLPHERVLLGSAPHIDAFGAGLGVTAALLRDADVVVANDSGLMHLATAVRARVVALFGPTVRAFGFFPYHAEATVLERALRCRPCSRFGGARCPRRHHRCLRDIRPDDVHEVVSAA